MPDVPRDESVSEGPARAIVANLTMPGALPSRLTTAALRPTLRVMEVHFNPDLEKKLEALAAQSGREADELVQDVVAGYFDELAEVRSHIEEGFSQAERGELIDGVQARREIQASKDAWLRERSPKG